MPTREANVSSGDPALVDAIVAHLRANVGEPTTIARDPDGTYVRADIVVIRRERDTVLCTAGMAERRIAEDVAVWTELVIRLPASWPLDAAALAEPAHRWPLAWLRYLARMPHASGLPFDIGHSAGPLFRGSASPFNGIAFVDSAEVPPLQLAGREITFLACIPLFEAEAEAASREGALAVVDAIQNRELVDVARAPIR